MIEKESLTHRIEDDMERRNRNWDIIKAHLRNYTEQVGNPANLTTVSKEVVGAVNELKDEIDTNKEELTQHKQDYAEQINGLKDEKRILRYNKQSQGWEKFRAELPFRVQNIKTIEDWTNPTGWSTGSPTILTETGEPAFGMTASNAANVKTDKVFDNALELGKNFVFPLEIDNVENLGVYNIVVYFATDSTFANYFYAQLCDVTELKNGTNLVILNRGNFNVLGTPSWKAIKQIRIRVYTLAEKTVNVKIGKIQTYDTKALCTIWFDDGEITQYTEAYNYMKTKEIVGACSIITNCINSPGYISRKQMLEMKNSGWELVNHTTDPGNLTTLSLEEAEFRISKAMEYLLGVSGRGAFHFVAPNAGINDDINAIIKKYAISSRHRASFENPLPVWDTYSLGVRQVLNNTSVETVKTWINNAITNGSWLILLYHNIYSPADSAMKVTPENFKAIVDYLDLEKTNIKTVTPSEALNY